MAAFTQAQLDLINVAKAAGARIAAQRAKGVNVAAVAANMATMGGSDSQLNLWLKAVANGQTLPTVAWTIGDAAAKLAMDRLKTVYADTTAVVPNKAATTTTTTPTAVQTMTAAPASKTLWYIAGGLGLLLLLKKKRRRR